MPIRTEVLIQKLRQAQRLDSETLLENITYPRGLRLRE